MSAWANWLKIPADFIENGIRLMDAGSQMVKTGIGAITGQNGHAEDQVPLNGPNNMDAAVAEIANQLVRVGYLTPRNPKDLLGGAERIWQTARRSFSYLNVRDPRILAAPVEFPLAVGGILADTLMRMMAVYQIVGLERLPRLMREAIEAYSDTAVFISLQYKELIDKYVERLNREPNDWETRLLLGRLYTKCGSYDQAAIELVKAAENSDTRARALADLVVADYRGGSYEEAINSGVAAMEANPGNERVRNMLWLASEALGGYPERVPAEYRMEIQCGHAPTTVEYENIAAKIGLLKTNSGRGSVIFDYNNDGWLDVAISGPHSGCSLYRNNGDGTFTDVSVESGMDECVNGFAMVAGDYNNDGYQDLFVTGLGFYHGKARLFRNNGNGTFTDVTEESGLTSWGPSFSAVWVDYNCDGLLDLFVTYNFAELFDKHRQNRLFRNNGDGTFTDVTAESGLFSKYTTIGAAWGDYDNDGYPDLFLSSFMGKPALFHNNGDGTFTDVSEEAGFTEPLLGFVCSFLDYDNDGWMDIAQFIWSDHDDFVYTLRNGKGPEGAYPTRIYHNNRDGTFTVKDREIGLDGCWGTMSANAGDINNDGNLDIVLGNGSPRMERLEPPAVLQSDGRRFRNVTFTAGLPPFGKGHGVNFADLFGDGRLSVIIADGGAYPGDLQQTSVYCPKKLPGNYLNVRLRGSAQADGSVVRAKKKSNRDAIGARVTLHANGIQQVREVFPGTGFGSLPYEQHFGLRDLKRVDAIEIRWPSGLRQRIDNPPVNDTILITEDQDGWERVYRK